MITAEELLETDKEWTKKTLELMIEFAKMHVTEALKQASENAESYVVGGLTSEVDKNSILESYPLENIK